MMATTDNLATIPAASAQRAVDGAVSAGAAIHGSAADSTVEAVLTALTAGLHPTGGTGLGVMLAGNLELTLEQDGMTLNLHIPKNAIDARPPSGFLDVDDMRLLSRLLARAADAIDTPAA
jgi:hypothetical protein